MSADQAVGKRHLSPDGFGRFLDSGVPVSLPIEGTPTASVFIEPRGPELGLRIRVDSSETLPATGLQNLITRRVHRESATWSEVVVTLSGLFRDAYPFLCAMADRVQLDKLGVAEALRVTLDKMSLLLRAGEPISREREIGLHGELLFLRGLLDALGPQDAIRAWRGGSAEEHDFGLGAVDVEVKTTSGERRAHWIESLTQLEPTGKRPLWLVSTQLTAAGGGPGVTLPELVDATRSAVGSGHPRDALEAGLSGAGWTEDSRGHCRTPWTRRAPSLAFHVDDGFPKLTGRSLVAAGVSLERVPDVRYRVDLTTLPPDSAPETILDAIGHEGLT